MTRPGDEVYLCIDPGGTTGWALCVGTRVCEEGQDDFETFCTRLAGFMSRCVDEGRPTIIIVERYDISAETLRKSRQYEALYVIGMLKYVAAVEGIEVVMSQRNQKTFARDDRLEAAGWLSRPLHDKRHQNDAKRHLYTWMVKTKRMSPIARKPCTCESFGNGTVSGNDGRLPPEGGCERHANEGGYR